MTTVNYQYTYLWMVLSILITCTLSLQVIPYNTMFEEHLNTVEKIVFQKNAITIAGGVMKYKKKNLVYNSLCGEFPRAEFASDKTGNGPFLTRYQTTDGDDQYKWDTRIENALKFEPFNQNHDKSVNQSMISNNLYYSGMILYNNENDQTPLSYYITSLYHTGGVKVLKDMLTDDEGFLQFMSNPYKRMSFYLDFVRIWKKLAVALKMRICVGSPPTITVRVPDDENPTYRPIFRHPEWAVGLGQPCEDYAPNYSSKSILIGKLENTETYQKTIETFTLGRIIYYIEIILAHQTYEKIKGVNTILDEMSAREAKIYEDRGSTEETYSNTSLFEAHGVYRKIIKQYREANPIQDGDTNKVVNDTYEEMFDLVDKMVGENDLMNGRPNWDNVGTGFIKLAQKVAPFYQERRLVLI